MQCQLSEHVREPLGQRADRLRHRGQLGGRGGGDVQIFGQADPHRRAHGPGAAIGDQGAADGRGQVAPEGGDGLIGG